MIRSLALNMKGAKYGRRIMEIEKSTFTPLIFSVTGGCGKECNTVLKKLATMISEKTGNTQSAVMSSIRTEISFSLLRSCIVCLRGWRRPKRTFTPEDTDFDITRARTHATLLDQTTPLSVIILFIIDPPPPLHTHTQPFSHFVSFLIVLIVDCIFSPPSKKNKQTSGVMKN